MEMSERACVCVLLSFHWKEMTVLATLFTILVEKKQSISDIINIEEKIFGNKINNNNIYCLIGFILQYYLTLFYENDLKIYCLLKFKVMLNEKFCDY